MNPITQSKNIKKLSEQELVFNFKTSWHDEYKGSAWIFVGGLPYDLTEGDVICVFSQYGEIVNINLVRDKKTGKSKGFAFICYEDQRSTVLAVDNLNHIKILGRIIRVDHVKDYKPPKDNEKLDDITRRLHAEGCAPAEQVPEDLIKRERREPPPAPPPVADTQSGTSDVFRLPPRLPIGRGAIKEEAPEASDGGIRLPPRLPIGNARVKKEEENGKKKKKKKEKKKKEKKSKKSKRRSRSSSSE